MDLKGTQTERNLLLAYTGESLNRNLYTYFARQAREEGYEQIAEIFSETAGHEQEHARQELLRLGTSDVELPAGVYPVKGVGTTLTNLETAVSGEHYESATMYPDFANTAVREDFAEVGELFRYIATVEAIHERRFRTLLERVRAASVFLREDAVPWRCRVCGFVTAEREAPSSCPLCRQGRGFFECYAEAL